MTFFILLIIATLLTIIGIRSIVRETFCGGQPCSICASEEYYDDEYMDNIERNDHRTSVPTPVQKEECPDLSDYTLKTNIRPPAKCECTCPAMPDMHNYIPKTELKPCDAPPVLVTASVDHP